MPERTLEDRVTALEGTVAGLQELPKQLASFQRGVAAFQRDVAARFEQVDARFERLERIVRDGDERNYSQMRMLHEDLVAKIALLGERRDGPDRRPRRPKR
jgi:uncharacterized coiled-coil protein SlyX